MAASDDLPGHELVAAGLADLDAGRRTEAALLVRMAGPRLRRLGFERPDDREPRGAGAVARIAARRFYGVALAALFASCEACCTALCAAWIAEP